MSCDPSCFSCDIVLLLRKSSSFQHENSVATEFPLSRQYFVHSSNRYVATSIIMSQHNFNAASASWCRDPSFHVAIDLYSGYVVTLFYIFYISVVTQKVYRDRGLLPMSLTSCCSFVLMLRHDFFVLSIFVVATRLFCVQLTRYVTTQFVMSRQHFFALC